MKTKLVEFIGRIQDGGAETLVKDYALMLDKEKFDVTILCEDYREDSAVYKTLKENGVKIVAMYERSFFINKVLARLFGKRYVSISQDSCSADMFYAAFLLLRGGGR